jgi:hypothetical protein
MKAVRINTGSLSIPIEDEDGMSLGIIKIYPGDFDILSRQEIALKNIGNIIEAMKDINEDTEESVFFTTMHDVSEKVKIELNYMFDYDVSSTIFKNQNCLAVCDGKVFAINMIEALMPVIASEVEKEMKKSEKKMSKYTAEYIKESKSSVATK